MRIAPAALALGIDAAESPVPVVSDCGTPPASVPSRDSAGAIAAAFRARWRSNRWLGRPVGSVCSAPDGRGRFRHFARGAIYWSPATGAHAVRGAIRQHWAAAGGERGPLGYPMTDEIATYDGLARVTKFQGGQLSWRPWTNRVTAVMTRQLALRLPTPLRRSWVVVQANAVADSDSHRGAWVYCYDFAAADGRTEGQSLLSTANARVVQVLEGSNGAATSNVVVQHLGLGRYASSRHVMDRSYSATFGSGKAPLTLATPWRARPVAAAGEPIARVGETGTGDEHIHFCVTTAPDTPAFAPFESVPFAFRDYEASTDGLTWTKVALGRPAAGTFVRHGPARPHSGRTAPGVAETLLHFGRVRGTVRRPRGAAWPAGIVVVRAATAWGEPLGASANLAVSPAAAGRAVAYTLPALPNYAGVRVEATFVGTTPDPTLRIASGASASFAVTANATTTVDVEIPF